ncbi:MAG: copper amine oxidase N-terminal domain-containing protein [Tissierellia bacterium]|nr:copper amine oxidase N-terminal domain-containing protein [Tissierellia bacterium]
MKKLQLLLILLLLCLLPQRAVAKVTPEAQEPSITITLNGEKVPTDVPPILKNDRTLVPIRFISQALDHPVRWDQKSKTVYILGPNLVELTVNEKTMTVDGKAIPLDVAPILHQDRTMVPLRAISEAFNIHIQWDQPSRTVLLMTDPYGKLPPEEALFLTLLEHNLREYDGAFRTILTAQNEGYGTMEEELDGAQRKIEYLLNSKDAMVVPKGYEDLFQLYHRTIGSSYGLINEYRRAYENSDAQAAASSLSRFFYLSFNRDELRRALDSLALNGNYEISQEYEEFSQESENPLSIFNDNLLGGLMEKLLKKQ